MSVDWDGYEIYEPVGFGPVHTLPRREARQEFNQVMQARAERIDMLRRLLDVNGVTLGSSDEAVQDLNDWFRLNVAEDPDKPGRLLPEWYSVVVDVALFLGEVMIDRHPHLHWEFFIWGKKNVSYQQHVIMGFSTEDPKRRTNIDIERAVATYGHRIIHGHTVEENRFWDYLRSVAGRA